MFIRDDARVTHRHYWMELLVCSLTIFAWPTSVVGQEQTVENVIKTLSQKIEQGDYSAATKFLHEVDAAALAARIKKGDDFKYLAVDGYAAGYVPGIPQWRAQLAHNNGRFKSLPGTSDYWRTKTEAEFQEAAICFAAKFNTYARYFGTEVEPKLGEVELSTVREGLLLTNAEWERIPLHARLAIRGMAEQLIEHEEGKRKASGAKKKTAQ